MRQVKGFSENDAARIVLARGEERFHSADDMWRDAPAFRSQRWLSWPSLTPSCRRSASSAGKRFRISSCCVIRRWHSGRQPTSVPHERRPRRLGRSRPQVDDAREGSGGGLCPYRPDAALASGELSTTGPHQEADRHLCRSNVRARWSLALERRAGSCPAKAGLGEGLLCS